MEFYANKENESDDRRLLLAITVEIEDGVVEYIEMKEGDSAEAVAVKFCHDHSLPDQFVAPLTEHIVSNIISISQEDKDIVFCTKDECTSFEDHWPQQIASHDHPCQDRHNSTQADQEKPSRFRDCPTQTSGLPLSQSQKVNKAVGSRITSTPKKATVKPRHIFTGRLLAPTHTSRAKMSMTEPMEKKVNKGKSFAPLSDKEKSVYMRLYAEFMNQKQKLEDDKRRIEELYQEKLERERTSISKKSSRIMRMRGRTAKQYRNYGELLYREALSKRQNQQKLIAKKLKDDEAKVLAEMTGVPEISKRAKQIRREEGQVWNRLQSEGKLKKDQLQSRTELVWETKLECTFKPQTNQRRLEGSEDYQDCSTSRFDQLFLDAESRRRRQEEYLLWYPEGVTFQPTINKKANDLKENVNDSNQSGQSVFDRLLQYASKLNEKKQLQAELSNRPIDQNTGREFFRPLTGRKPQIDRNPLTLPIGDFLYSMRFFLDNKLECLNQRDHKLQQDQANYRYVGANSQKLLGRIRQRGFKQVFDILDDDKDGLVKLASANLQQLSQDIVEDVKQVIKMGADDTPISFDKFVKFMVAVQEKTHKGTQLLVLKHKTHTDDNDSTHHIKMDRLSRNLSMSRRKFSTKQEWYKLICMDREKGLQKVDSLRKEKEALEMAECTFRPELYGRGNKSSKGRSLKGSHSEEIQSPNSIVERETQEVHGFYFKDEHGPGWPGETGLQPHTTEIHTDEIGPMGLLDSLTLMVAQSSDGNPYGHKSILMPSTSQQALIEQTNMVQDQQADTLDPSDLPECNDENQSGMFFGLMGA
ncbi:unnamed protein product [Sphagnum jensenii]|uniref:Uncharacterized protein n=1 Tax=Sphagnum jensenii TaxID=128206 RepID=A0ABP1C3F5_9BRYO